MAEKATEEAPTPEAPSQGVTAPGDPGNLDQVRELLFGSHSRELEKRLALVEKRLDHEVAKLTDETAHRIGQLERYIKNELTGLIEKLGVQREERSVLFQQMTREMDSRSKGLDKRFDDLGDRMAKVQSEMRAEILRQVNTMSEEIQRTSDDLTQLMGVETGSLRAEMVDRAVLSDTLSEVALRLAQQNDAVPEPIGSD